MKITLEFSDEQQGEAKAALQAGAMLATLIEIREFLRGKIKYECVSSAPEALAAYETVYDTLNCSLSERGILLDA
jgi:hypothetical protein